MVQLRRLVRDRLFLSALWVGAALLTSGCLDASVTFPITRELEFSASNLPLIDDFQENKQLTDIRDTVRILLEFNRLRAVTNCFCKKKRKISLKITREMELSNPVTSLPSYKKFYLIKEAREKEESLTEKG